MILIDLISSIIINEKTAQYTGGTNYVINIIKQLQNEEFSDETIKIILPFSSEGKIDISWISFEVVYAKSLEEYNYAGVRVLFLPQVNGTTLRNAYRIKRAFPDLKIYGTLHDRQHNLRKYDWYNQAYFSKITEKVKDIMTFYGRKVVFNTFYSKWISKFDKVFTDSNYSMQCLDNKKIKFLSYYSQGNYLSLFDCNTNAGINGEYALMVGAGRTEKNLLRTLEAFCSYIVDNNSGLKLVITGVKKELADLLQNSKKLEKTVIQHSVIFQKYVSYEELCALYRQCRFVVFTSKAEGYGLPILEAIMFEKAVIASRQTSIPEVGGAAVYYVDAYSSKSIKGGFEYFDNDKNVFKYSQYAKEKKVILQKQISLDYRAFVSELLSK